MIWLEEYKGGRATLDTGWPHLEEIGGGLCEDPQAIGVNTTIATRVAMGPWGLDLKEKNFNHLVVVTSI